MRNTPVASVAEPQNRIRASANAAGTEISMVMVTTKIETSAEQSRASSPRWPALAYCQGTVLRTEIETREPGRLESATDYVAAALARKHGNGEVAAKIQAHIVLAAA